MTQTTVFLDVREPFEYARSHVEGAINLPPAALMDGAKEIAHLPKDTPLVLYCISGARSNASMHYLRQLGYTNLTNGINQQQVQAKYSV